MKDYVAVTHDARELKRLLFLFDRVGLAGLEALLYVAANGLSLPEEGMEISPHEQFHDELMKLVEKRIIFEPLLAEPGSLPRLSLQELVPSGEFKSDYEQELYKKLEENNQQMGILALVDVILRGQKKGLFQDISLPADRVNIKSRLDDSHKRIRDLEIRLIAARMRGMGQEAYPIIEVGDYSDFAVATPKSTVIEVLLTGIPMPEDEISFGRLMEFREDEKSRRLLLSLRRWIRKISNEKLSPVELANEIEWQICENREHMRLHKLRAKNTLWKIILKCPLDIIENLMRIRLTKSIDAIFEAREVNVSLLAEELKAPGRELSYIAKIRENFR